MARGGFCRKYFFHTFAVLFISQDDSIAVTIDTFE